ncbi:hypothetical protein MYCFIDRAFT_59029 [Lecanosticta acicola]|uniref:ENTH domain-containing protein n=1 Tax=Lecanosticta acicola TaxID=111012 RepID=A0AAI8YRG5_9PEZI|nr:hypothetical protein MYCFIDRAFT_59029 [Lecanosticta acicola]
MDLNSLRDQVSNLTLYDVKAGIRKVQNAVMNYTEMESKVREATNNEPWGASSTMMQEIANGTFNYQLLNEIMPMIYKRFTEKSAEEWRQIYKALQLMEFLIKNGSERVIDDARSHTSLIKMLRQFHYIDQNGKDQGINVRNRSKELSELLSDVDRIRAERKKARATKNKYGGVEGGTGLSFGPSGGSSRYGGFGSETGGYPGGGPATFGGSTRSVYGDGGGFGGEEHDEYDEGSRRGNADRFDEYDEFDDGGAQAAPGRRKADTAARAKVKKPEPAKPKEPEVDLFDFGDDEPAAPSNGAQASAAVLSPPMAATSSAAAADDDDFDDFQSATPATTTPAASTMPAISKPNYSSISTATTTTTSSTQFAQPSPQSGAQKADFGNLFSTASPPPSSTATPSMSGLSSPMTQQSKLTGYQPSGPNYFTSVQTQQSGQQVSTPGPAVTSPVASIGGGKPKKAGGDAFANLLSGSGMKKNAAPAQKGMTIADMAKQKSQAGLYGANAPAAMSAQPQSRQKPSGGSSGLDDLLG